MDENFCKNLPSCPTCDYQELGELANAYAELQVGATMLGTKRWSFRWSDVCRLAQGNLHTQKKLKMEAEALPSPIWKDFEELDVPNGFAFVGLIII